MFAPTSDLSTKACGLARSARCLARRGAMAVEFAIVSMILFVVVLGIIEIARGIMVVHELNDAAGIGCRMAVVQGTTTAQVTTAVSDYLAKVGITAPVTVVKVNGSVADPVTAKQSDQITVSVTVAVSTVTWVPTTRYLTGTTLSGQCSLRHE